MKTRLTCILCLPGFFSVLLGAAHAERPEAKFRTVEIDSHLGVGSDLSIADVDGDGKLDLIVADRQSLVWYRNPDWKRILIAGKLSPYEHITISAAGKAGNAGGPLEFLAVTDGTPWDPASAHGEAFFLTPGTDRAQPWSAKAMPISATAHRAGWFFDQDGSLALMEIPLHGMNNSRDGLGEGVQFGICKSRDLKGGEWVSHAVPTKLHLTHGFVPYPQADGALHYLIACKEGVAVFTPASEEIHLLISAERDGAQGAGEVCHGTLLGGRPFISTIEPLHGSQVVIYTEAAGHLWQRTVIDQTLNDGHALVCGALFKDGSDQIVAGSRIANGDGKFGVALYKFNPDNNTWRKQWIDENGMSCERLALADVDGDGRMDVVAAGRASHNLKVYLNDTP